ncbi:hypothetical protein GCM10009660_26090 [Catellatospora bangladeshensis]
MAASVPVVCTLWSVAVPGGYFGLLLVALTCWVVVVAAWAAVGVLAVAALPRPRSRRLGRLWPCALVPALLVATWATARSGVVERVVFEAHRPELERLVADVQARPDRRVDRREVGLYSISRATADPNGPCTLITLRHGDVLLGSSGFAYCPERAPTSTRLAEGYSYTPIDGPWYEFVFTW